MLPQSALTLNDEGVLGIRSVDANSIVQFHPVQLIRDTPNGVWLGGLWFHALIAIVVGLMVWELVTMLDTGRSKSAIVLAVVSGLASMIAIEIPASLALPLLMMPAMLGLGRMERGGVTYGVLTGFILVAG